MCYLTNQTALENVELHVVQLTEILSHLSAITGFILYYFNLLLIKLDRIFFLFLDILSSFARPQMKVLIVKFKLLPRKTSISAISLTFFY